MRRFLILVMLLATACGAIPTPVTPTVTDTPEAPTPTDTPQAPQAVEATITPDPGPWYPWYPAPPVVTGLEPPFAQTVMIVHDGDAVPVKAYVLLGADWQTGRESYNTDTIVLILVNDVEGFVSLVSIPRDLLVYVPGVGMERINGVFALRGPEAMLQVMAYNFGVEIIAWASIEMEGFIDLVNALGGIDIIPAADLIERCYGADFQLAAGMTYHLDGRHALCYARNRGTSNDFSRMPRQQEVLIAMYERFPHEVILGDPVALAASLFDIYESFVWTNADWTLVGPDIARLLGAGFLANEDRFRFYVIGSDLVQEQDLDGIGQSLLLSRDAREMQALIQQAALGE